MKARVDTEELRDEARTIRHALKHYIAQRDGWAEVIVVRSDADRLDAAAAELDALRAVVEALPKCRCGEPATARVTWNHTMWCDAHGDPVRVDLPYAAALRVLLGAP
jgi:hypothetical protein